MKTQYDQCELSVWPKCSYGPIAPVVVVIIQSIIFYFITYLITFRKIHSKKQQQNQTEQADRKSDDHHSWLPLVIEINVMQKHQRTGFGYLSAIAIISRPVIIVICQSILQYDCQQ